MTHSLDTSALLVHYLAEPGAARRQRKGGAVSHPSTFGSGRGRARGRDAGVAG